MDDSCYLLKKNPEIHNFSGRGQDLKCESENSHFFVNEPCPKELILIGFKNCIAKIGPNPWV